MDIYEIVTRQILDMLEKGVIPWRKPWDDAAISYTSRKGYKGINALLLQKPGEYITFNQVKKLGGKVKAGAKSCPVVLYKMVPVKDHDTGEDKKIPLPIRYYRVFHLDDTEGIPSKLKPRDQIVEDASTAQADEMARQYTEREHLPIIHAEQNRAYYTPTEDTVTLPKIDQFHSAKEYYGTLFHELTHSTGHKSRLARPGVMDKAAAFGSSTYGQEELVAEMGSAMLYSIAGLGDHPVLENSAAYIDSWAKAIKADNRLILRSANQAQRAAEFLQGIKPETYDNQEED